MKLGNFNIGVALALGLALASGANAHESDREARLKAANDELTNRVAEFLKENKRLEEFAKQALIATSNKQRVVAGCDTQALRETMVTDHGQAWVAQKWLKENGKKCTKEQLQYLLENLYGWSKYSQGDPIRHIRFLLEN